MAVLPEYRGQGIGTKLLMRLLAAAKGQYADVSLSVGSGNPAAHLYERLGFEVVSDTLLDGMAVTAAALVAERLAPGARQWWQAGHRSTEPGHALALGALALEPILDLGMRLGEGSGAATALPVLRAAVATLAFMATFGEAGVSDRSSS